MGKLKFFYCLIKLAKVQSERINDDEGSCATNSYYLPHSRFGYRFTSTAKPNNSVSEYRQTEFFCRFHEIVRFVRIVFPVSSRVRHRSSQSSSEADSLPYIQD